VSNIATTLPPTQFESQHVVVSELQLTVPADQKVDLLTAKAAVASLVKGLGYDNVHVSKRGRQGAAAAPHEHAFVADGRLIRVCKHGFG
jgi:hypothetical protein